MWFSELVTDVHYLQSVYTHWSWRWLSKFSIPDSPEIEAERDIRSLRQVWVTQQDSVTIAKHFIAKNKTQKNHLPQKPTKKTNEKTPKGLIYLVIWLLKEPNIIMFIKARQFSRHLGKW